MVLPWLWSPFWNSSLYVAISPDMLIAPPDLTSPVATYGDYDDYSK